jgi:hypothetical protein
MCGDIQFVSREKWEAKQPNNTEHMPTPVSIVFVHHTVTAHCNNLLEGIINTQFIQHCHMDGNGRYLCIFRTLFFHFVLPCVCLSILIL